MNSSVRSVGAIRPFVTRMRSQVRLDGYVIACAALLLTIVVALVGENHIPFVLTAVAVLGLLRAQWQTTLILAFPIYGLGGALLSNVLIEDGAHISEQFRDGHANGATAALAIYSMLFLLAAHIGTVAITAGFYGKLRSSPPMIGRLARLLVIVLAVMIVLYLATILMFGSAWSYAGQRFDFWNGMPPAIRVPMRGVHFYLVPAVAALCGYFFVVARASWRRVLPIAILLTVLNATFFFTGEKASEYILTTTFLAVGIGIAGIGEGFASNATGKIVLIAGGLLVTIGLVAALGFSVYGVSNVGKALVSRAVLQGHVWYGIFDIHRGETGFIPLGELIRTGSMTTPAGIDRLALEIAPEKFVLARMKQGISFTMGGPAAFLAVFGGWLGGILFALSSVFYILPVRVAVYFLRRNLYLFALVPFAFLFIANKLTMMGDWEFLYHPVALAFYAVTVTAVVWELVARRRAAQSTIGERRPQDDSGLPQ